MSSFHPLRTFSEPLTRAIDEAQSGGEAAVIITLALAAMQPPQAPALPERDLRTAFCWVALTNATMRVVAQTRRMPDGVLSEALGYINGKMRGRFPDDGQLAEAVRAGSTAFGRADINEAASSCLQEYRDEMSHFSQVTIRAATQ